MGTLHTGGEKGMPDAQQLKFFFFRNLEKNKKLTSAENRKVFPLKLSLDSYINTRVTPTNSNCRDGLWSTAGSVGCK